MFKKGWLFLSALPRIFHARVRLGNGCPSIGLAVSDAWPDRYQFRRLPYDLALARAGARVVTLVPSHLKQLDRMLEGIPVLIRAAGIALFLAVMFRMDVLPPGKYEAVNTFKYPVKPLQMRRHQRYHARARPRQREVVGQPPELIPVGPGVGDGQTYGRAPVAKPHPRMKNTRESA